MGPDRDRLDTCVGHIWRDATAIKGRLQAACRCGRRRGPGQLHDCQVAIPLAAMSGQRVTCPCELMDAAYDSKDIAGHSRASGHVPIIAV